MRFRWAHPSDLIGRRTTARLGEDGLGVSHRRSVACLDGELWIVVDSLAGEGLHEWRLHWLGGDFPHDIAGEGRITLATPAGLFDVALYDDEGEDRWEEVDNGAILGEEWIG